MSEEPCVGTAGCHDWQVVAIPLTIQDLGLAPKIVIQFFRVCPWCKVSEDLPGRVLTPGKSNKAILS